MIKYVYAVVCVYNTFEYSGLDSLSNLSIFDSEEKARKEFKNIIEDDIKYYDWVVDEDYGYNLDNYKIGTIFRVFWKYQENWDNYYEIKIEKMEVK